MFKRIYLLLILSFAVTIAQANKSILVNLSQQRATAYENGRAVFSGNISSGKASRPTPTGSFRVLEKDINHVSSSWPKPRGGAKMHYMLRVTGYGIAMHLGRVPNYPASHGCIRMQNGFAQKMYRWASVGTPIRIVGHGRGRVSRGAFSNFRVTKSDVRRLRGKSSALDAISASPHAARRVAVRDSIRGHHTKKRRVHRRSRKKEKKLTLLQSLR